MAESPVTSTRSSDKKEERAYREDQRTRAFSVRASPTPSRPTYGTTGGIDLPRRAGTGGDHARLAVRTCESHVHDRTGEITEVQRCNYWGFRTHDGPKTGEYQAGYQKRTAWKGIGVLESHPVMVPIVGVVRRLVLGGFGLTRMPEMPLIRSAPIPSQHSLYWYSGWRVLRALWP